MGALVGGHPAEEEAVLALRVSRPVAEGERAGIDAVVDHGGDRNVGGVPALGLGDGDDRHLAVQRQVQRSEVFLQRAVDGGEDGAPRYGAAAGEGRSRQRVVVHHVAVHEGVVCRDGVAELGHREADPAALGVLEDPAALDRAGGVARGEQDHVVTGLGEPPGQPVHHELDAPVEGRWHGGPGRGDEADAHCPIQPRALRAPFRSPSGEGARTPPGGGTAHLAQAPPRMCRRRPRCAGAAQDVQEPPTARRRCPRCAGAGADRLGRLAAWPSG